MYFPNPFTLITKEWESPIVQTARRSAARCRVTFRNAIANEVQHENKNMHLLFVICTSMRLFVFILCVINILTLVLLLSILFMYPFMFTNIVNKDTNTN